MSAVGLHFLIPTALGPTFFISVLYTCVTQPVFITGVLFLVLTSITWENEHYVLQMLQAVILKHFVKNKIRNCQYVLSNFPIEAKHMLCTLFTSSDGCQ